MPANIRADMERGAQFRRQWQLVLILRRGSRSLEELAELLGCTTRTVRRDLAVLELVGLPARKTEPDERCGSAWTMTTEHVWPRNEALPTHPLPTQEVA